MRTRSSASTGSGYDRGCLLCLTRGCRMDRAITLNCTGGDDVVPGCYVGALEC
jgi:hypothetical protein